MEEATAAASRLARGVPRTGLASGSLPLSLPPASSRVALRAHPPRAPRLAAGVRCREARNHPRRLQLFRKQGTRPPDGAPTFERAARPCRAVSVAGPPSAHTSTLAAERRPSSRKGVDRRRHAAAGAKPCVSGWEENSPATGRDYQPIIAFNRMNPCAKCGHSPFVHDPFDGCLHQELYPVGKRTCICSAFTLKLRRDSEPSEREARPQSRRRLSTSLPFHAQLSTLLSSWSGSRVALPRLLALRWLRS
jgi:hypothetical protein